LAYKLEMAIQVSVFEGKDESQKHIRLKIVGNQKEQKRELLVRLVSTQPHQACHAVLSQKFQETIGYSFFRTVFKSDITSEVL